MSASGLLLRSLRPHGLRKDRQILGGGSDPLRDVRISVSLSVLCCSAHRGTGIHQTDLSGKLFAKAFQAMNKPNYLTFAYRTSATDDDDARTKDNSIISQCSGGGSSAPRLLLTVVKKKTILLLSENPRNEITKKRGGGGGGRVETRRSVIKKMSGGGVSWWSQMKKTIIIYIYSRCFYNGIMDQFLHGLLWPLCLYSPSAIIYYYYYTTSPVFITVPAAVND